MFQYRRCLLLNCNGVCSIDMEKKRVEVTFRSGDLERDKTSLSLADLHEGQKVDGRVKKVEDYGLFVEIEGSRLSGLCHKSEVRNFPASIRSALTILILYPVSFPITRTPMSRSRFVVLWKVTVSRLLSCRSIKKNERCPWA